MFERYGLDQVLKDFTIPGKEVVYSSERFGDTFTAALRWDVGEFREFEGHEVIASITADVGLLRS